MNKASTLQGNLLDTYRTPTWTSRRLFSLRCVMRVACKVPTNGLCPWLKQAPEPVEGPSRSLEVPQSLINKVLGEKKTK